VGHGAVSFPLQSLWQRLHDSLHKFKIPHRAFGLTFFGLEEKDIVGTCHNFSLLAARGDCLVPIRKTFDILFFDLRLITDFVFLFNFYYYHATITQAR
jgi:hypothetical protein